MNRLIISLIFLAYITTNAQNDSIAKNEKEVFVYAQQSDYLVPAQSLLNSYPYETKYINKVKEILFKGLPEYFDIQYFVTPSFGTERVLIIRKNKIYYHQAKKSIWHSYYKEIHNKTTKSENTNLINVERYNCNINKDDAILIEKLYGVAFSKARYKIFTKKELNNLVVGLDGTTYSFSLQNNGAKECVTWSPSKDSKMYRLVEINNELIRIIKRTDNNKILELSLSLKYRIKKLIDEIILTDYDFEKNTLSKIKDTIINHLNEKLDFEKLINMKNVSVGDDFIYSIKKGKIKIIKPQEIYYDYDCSKFRNWIDNLFYKDASKEYKNALKDLDLSFLDLELNLKVYINLTFDSKLKLIEGN